MKLMAFVKILTESLLSLDADGKWWTLCDHTVIVLSNKWGFWRKFWNIKNLKICLEISGSTAAADDDKLGQV